MRRAWHGDGDGVRAHHRLLTERRHDEGLGVRHGDAQQALIGSHLGIITGDAVVVGVADDNDADAGLLRLVNGHLHGGNRDGLADGIMRVDHGGDGRFADDLTLRAALDAADLQRMRIKLHALHAVGLDAHAVRCQQHVGNVLTVGAAVAIAGKNFHGQVPETLIIKITVSHS